MTLGEILGKRILVVTAHPDDESFLAGGLLYLNHSNGGQNFLLCATLGEKGRAHLDREHTDVELKACRKMELEASAKVLQLSDFVVLDYADSCLANNILEFGWDIGLAIEKWRPEIILGFGEDGFTGHADHVAVFMSASKVAAGLKIPYLAFALPPGTLAAQYIECLCKKRSHDKYHEHWACLKPDLRVAIDGEMKLLALRCYQSQWKGLDPYRIFSSGLAEHFLAFEYFRILGKSRLAKTRVC